MKQDRVSSFSPPLVRWLVVLIVAGIALGACASSSGKSKQRQIDDCIGAGNAPSVCRSWIGD
jgi:hypothetical protein